MLCEVFQIYFVVTALRGVAGMIVFYSILHGFKVASVFPCRGYMSSPNSFNINYILKAR